MRERERDVLTNDLLFFLPFSYDAEFCARRDREQSQRSKFKQGLSRSRDNFELGKATSTSAPTPFTF